MQNRRSWEGDLNPNWKMYVDAKWPSDPLLKLVGVPTPSKSSYQATGPQPQLRLCKRSTIYLQSTVTDIIGYITRTYPSQRVLLTAQVYEKLNPTSLRDVQTLLDWSELRVYDLNDAGKNHGILLGTNGWKS